MNCAETERSGFKIPILVPLLFQTWFGYIKSVLESTYFRFTTLEIPQVFDQRNTRYIWLASLTML
jgi:hypothetical protein